MAKGQRFLRDALRSLFMRCIDDTDMLLNLVPVHLHISTAVLRLRPKPGRGSFDSAGSMWG